MRKNITKLLLFLSAVTVQNVFAQGDPTATVGDTGTVSFIYKGEPVTYTTVRAADGKIWLQQNLGAAQIASSATDMDSYGDLFQWGRWDDGHQARASSTANTSTLSTNNPSGLGTGSANFYTGADPNNWWGAGTGADTWTSAAASATNGTDPCTGIGPGWHLPTVEEWGAVLTAETITGTGSAFASNLVLPAAGQRDPGNGMLVNVGTSGAYWAATPSIQYAKNVGFGDGFINAADDGYRGYGMSLRCLTDCTGVFPPEEVSGDDTVCSGDTVIFSVPDVLNANEYLWTMPATWAVVGSSNTDSITIVVNGSGILAVAAGNFCDTSSTVSLTIAAEELATPFITHNDDTLAAPPGFADYDWYLDGTLIPDSNDQTLVATAAGSYTVTVRNENGCTAASPAYIHTPVAIADIVIPQLIIYPNPATDILYVRAALPVNISIISTDGRQVLAQESAQQVDISALSNGLYLLRIVTTDGTKQMVQPLVINR